MEKSFKESMRWLHTWSGLIVGWILFAVFVTGTFSYYKDEVTLWMKPELHYSKESKNSLDIAKQKAIELAQNNSNISITLPNSRSNIISAMWREKSDNSHRAKRVYQYYDASSGENINTRQTAGGNFLYRFHFELYGFPRYFSRWAIALATMSMFVAIITGIIIHTRIFKDIFTLRAKANPRGWMDAHIIPAVAALPFHIMITYSGLLLFARLVMPWGMQAAYDGDFREYRSDLSNLKQTQIIHQNVNKKAQNKSLSFENLDKVLINANKVWPNNIGGFSISKNKNGSYEIQIRPKETSSIFSSKFEREYLTYDANTAKLISKNIPPTTNSNIINTNTTFATLHRAIFANSTMRFLFFICGISGIVLAGTGLVLWIEKRKKKQKINTSIGFKLVEKLNIGTITGLFIAIGIFFIANRVIEVNIENRHLLEINTFFIAWLLCYVHSFLRQSKKAWIEQMIITSIIYFSIPILNALFWTKDLLNREIMYFYFDLFFILTAIVFAIGSYFLIRNSKKGLK